MDTLTLKALRYEAPHGFYKEERRNGNRFEVDVILEGNFREAGASDDLERAADYQRAGNAVREIMEGPSVRLIETLACRIGERLHVEIAEAARIEVAVRKMDPPLHGGAQYSEIRMEWKR